MSMTQNDETQHMQVQLNKLVELQELDNEIIEFEEERDKIPEQLEKHEDILLEKRKVFEEKENLLHALDEEKSEKERFIELEKLKLKNTKNKETAIQNIKQYEAYVKEVEAKELSREELEDELKSLSERVETLKTELVSLSSEIESLNGEQSSERKELEERIALLDETLERLYDQRDDLAENVDEGLYLKYEYIAERKYGVAVALVQHGHCQVCNMAIPPQMYNELIRGDQLMACPACNRILVYRESHEEEEE